MAQNDRYVEVDWAFGTRLRSLREAKGWTVAQLAAHAGVSERAIQLLEAGEQRRPRRNTISLLATALGETLEALIEPAPLEHASELCGGSLQFDGIRQLARAIDAYLLGLIRDHQYAAPQLVAEGHRDLVRARLADAGLRLEQFLSLLEDPKCLDQLCETLPEPDLVLSVGPDFDWLTFEAGSHHLRVDRPLLLWDCHCKTPGSPAGPEACPIHSQVGSAEVASAMANGHVEIRWRSLRIRWERDAALWPPAIDSFVLVQNLERSGLLSNRPRRLLDLGCGTGFLAAAIAEQSESVRHVTLAEWLLLPLLYGSVNLALNFPAARKLTASPKLALLTNSNAKLPLGLHKADLAVCNPPYLPLLSGFESLGQHSSVAGTDLLGCVIRQAQRLASTTVVQFSCIASPEAESAAAEAGMQLAQIGDEREVPFRVLHALERSGYTTVLQQQRGLVVRENDRHVNWHRLRTYALVPCVGRTRPR